MPVVAFEILSASVPHASRKPAAHADREGSTPFSDMLDSPAKKPAARKAAKDAPKDAPKDAASPASAPAHDKGDKAAAMDAKAPAAAGTTDTAAADAALNDQNTAADAFLTAVAATTGLPVAPVDAPKTEAKSGDAKDGVKNDDQSDDAAKVQADATVTASQATPIAAVVAAPAEAAAATDALPAETTTASTALTTAAAEQGLLKATTTDDAETKTETKADAKIEIKAAVTADVKTDTKTDATADKPQAAAKLDAPLLIGDASGKPAANSQAAQPQQAQGQKPAADQTAQAAKPAPVHHDASAADAATVAKPADAIQALPLLQNNAVAQAQTADQAAATPAANAPQAVALPVAGIAIEIASKALEGKNRFDIRLDPPELGKIHVQLDVDHKGEVTSIITADRSDTFDLLRRDAQSLERALQDAGVKTSSSGLQFSLRDQGQQNTPSQFADSTRVVVRDNTIDTEITAPVYRSLSGTRAGLDIRV